MKPDAKSRRSSSTDEEIFEAHVAGKLSVELKAPLDTQRALSIAYTPGVAQVSRAIAADHTLAARYTWANRLVAVGQRRQRGARPRRHRPGGVRCR